MLYRTPSPRPEASAGVYRDDAEGLRIMLAAEHKRHLSELAALSPAVFTVFRRRLAALGGGGVLLAGGLLLFTVTMIRLVSYPSVYSASSTGVLTMILLGSWAAAAAAYGVLFAMGPALLAGRVQRALPGEDVVLPLADQLDRARVFDASILAVKQCDRLERPSAILTLMGISLLMPLTLHYLVASLVALLADGNVMAARDFDSWISISTLVVGHVHAVVLWHSWRAGKRFYRTEPLELDLAAHDEGWRVWKWATVSSCVPGLLLLIIPVFMVAATGLFLPIVYTAVARRIGSQRDALVSALPQNT